MAKRDAFETTIKNGISSSINSYNGEKKENPIDILQKNVTFQNENIKIQFFVENEPLIHFKLKCCGSDGYADWFSTNWSIPNNKVPESCCKIPENCIHENLPPKNATGIWEQVSHLNCLV